MILANRRGQDDAGFGLIELVVALTIMSIVMAGIAYGIMTELSLTADSRGREVGANLASQSIDAARAVANLSTLQAATWTSKVNGVTYTVLQTVTDYSAGAASPCDGSSASAIVYKRVSIRVSWPNMIADPVMASTLIAPSTSSFNPALGNIGVKVLDAGANPVYGALVNITNGATSYSSYSDVDGCAFFDALTPGTFTVTGQLAGYVTTDGTSAPSTTASVNQGSTTRVAFNLDSAAELDVFVPDETYAAPANMPLTIGNSSLQPTGSRLEPGTGPRRALVDLFPFASGYTLWAGSCSDADPAGQIMVNGSAIGPYYAGAVRDPATSVTTGFGQASVTMAKVTVNLQTNAGLAVSGSQISATHVVAGGGVDPGCPAGEVWVLGVTNQSGSISASLPWGDWQFQAAGTTAPAVINILAPAANVYAIGLRTP